MSDADARMSEADARLSEAGARLSEAGAHVFDSVARMSGPEHSCVEAGTWCNQLRRLSEHDEVDVVHGLVTPCGELRVR